MKPIITTVKVPQKKKLLTFPGHDPSLRRTIEWNPIRTDFGLKSIEWRYGSVEKKGDLIWEFSHAFDIEYDGRIIEDHFPGRAMC